MGSVFLYTDPRASYYYFRDDVFNQPHGSYIYLLPLNRAVRYLKRDLIKQSPQDAVFDPLFFTFRSLMKTLNQKRAQGKKIITDAMILVLLQDFINLDSQELESIFPPKSVTGISNLIRRLNQMLTELNHFGYHAESFIDPPPGAESRYRDFSFLMKRIQQSFQDELIDETGIISETIAALDEGWLRKIFPKLKHLYISGYGIYTPLMLRFLAQMQQWVDLHISLVYTNKNPDLFDHTQDAWDALRKITNRLKINNPPVDGLEYFLFNQRITKPHKIKDIKRIHIQAAHNLREEISFIAFKIKELHHSQHIPLHHIGITFPNPEIYAPLLRVVLSEYKIPFNLSTGFSLAQSPLIQCFLRCLEVIRNNYSVKDVLELLFTPFFRNPYPIETTVVIKILQKKKVLYFHTNWVTYVAEWINETKYKDSEDRDLDINGCIDFIARVFNELKKLDKKQSAADFQTSFLTCLKELGLLNWYEHAHAPLSRSEQEKEFRAFNQFIKLLNQMIWILQYKDAELIYSVLDFEIYLREIVQNAVYNLREWPDYGVQIMPRLEIQSVDLEVLFIGGLIEGVFPRKFVKDIFFNDTEREIMGLNASEDLQSQDRFLFYQLLSCPRGQIYLSYPSFDNESKQIRSSFIDNLCKISGITENDELSSQYLINERNILIHAGKNVFTDKPDEWSAWLSYVTPDDRKFWLRTLEDMYRIFDRSAITIFEGNLTANKKISNYLKEKTDRDTFSISSLESYLFCPMQYFLHRIVHLEPEEEEEELLTAQEKGILIHRILFRFYSELKVQNKHNEPWNHEDLLIRIAREEFAAFPYKGFLWDLEQENYFGTEPMKSLWHTFLESEKVDTQKSGFIPSYFEMAFGQAGGKKEKDPISAKEPLTLKKDKRTIRLSGKIDRIDMDESGRFFVVDYKTGSATNRLTRKIIESGQSLQLPIYIEAVSKRFLECDINAFPGGGAYYFLGGPDIPKKKIVIDETNRIRVFDNVIQTVFELVQRLEDGNFTHTENPDDLRCARYCAFARICRKDRTKLITRKNKNIP